MPKKKVKIKQKARVQKRKNEGSIPKAPTRLAGDNAANFKVKVRKK